jgi:hypothetical protein
MIFCYAISECKKSLQRHVVSFFLGLILDQHGGRIQH